MLREGRHLQFLLTKAMTILVIFWEESIKNKAADGSHLVKIYMVGDVDHFFSQSD